MTNQEQSTLIYFGMWKGKIVASIFNIPNRRRHYHMYASRHGGSAAPRRGEKKKWSCVPERSSVFSISQHELCQKRSTARLPLWVGWQSLRLTTRLEKRQGWGKQPCLSDNGCTLLRTVGETQPGEVLRREKVRVSGSAATGGHSCESHHHPALLSKGRPHPRADKR